MLSSKSPGRIRITARGAGVRQPQGLTFSCLEATPSSCVLGEFVTLQERCGTGSLPGWCSLRVTGGSYSSAAGLLDRLSALSMWSCQDSFAWGTRWDANVERGVIPQPQSVSKQFFPSCHCWALMVEGSRGGLSVIQNCPNQRPLGPLLRNIENIPRPGRSMSESLAVGSRPPPLHL